MEFMDPNVPAEVRRPYMAFIGMCTLYLGPVPGICTLCDSPLHDPSRVPGGTPGCRHDFHLNCLSDFITADPIDPHCPHPGCGQRLYGQTNDGEYLYPRIVRFPDDEDDPQATAPLLRGSQEDDRVYNQPRDFGNSGSDTDDTDTEAGEIIDHQLERISLNRDEIERQEAQIKRYEERLAALRKAREELGDAVSEANYAASDGEAVVDQPVRGFE